MRFTLETALIGDIYRFSTANGPAYLHHVAKDQTWGDVVAVHTSGIMPESPDKLEQEAFALLFPIAAATKHGLTTKVGRGAVPGRFHSGNFRYPFHDRHGKFCYWVVREGGKERRGLKSLTKAQLSYPLSVAVDAAALEQLICAGYNSDNIELFG